jgi:hypothetical protein
MGLEVRLREGARPREGRPSGLNPTALGLTILSMRTRLVESLKSA